MGALDQDAPARVSGAVRAEMARARFSQQRIADALGLSQAAVSRRLTGEVPFSATELAVVAKLLNVRVGTLYGESNNIEARESGHGGAS